MAKQFAALKNDLKHAQSQAARLEVYKSTQTGMGAISEVALTSLLVTLSLTLVPNTNPGVDFQESAIDAAIRPFQDDNLSLIAENMKLKDYLKKAILGLEGFAVRGLRLEYI